MTAALWFLAGVACGVVAGLAGAYIIVLRGWKR